MVINQPGMKQTMNTRKGMLVKGLAIICNILGVVGRTEAFVILHDLILGVNYYKYKPSKLYIQLTQACWSFQTSDPLEDIHASRKHYHVKNLSRSKTTLMYELTQHLQAFPLHVQRSSGTNDILWMLYVRITESMYTVYWNFSPLIQSEKGLLTQPLLNC